jgi:hypothetical protein
MVHIAPVKKFGIDPVISLIILEFGEGGLNEAQKNPDGIKKEALVI